MLTINSTSIPDPSSFEVDIEDIVKAERVANGNLVKDIIATKRKCKLEYKHLSESELSALLVLVANNFFTFSYPDSQTGATRTGTFYCGGRSAGMIDYDNGAIRWKDIRFNLIER